MAVISDVLRGPYGDIQPNVIITMQAKGTTARVLTSNRSSTVTDTAGKYSMTVFPGEYEVTVSTLGHVGDIRVLPDSVNGTLNDFLIAPAKPEELTPEVVRTVDTMRAESAASAAAAKTSETNAAAAMTNALSKTVTTAQDVVSTVTFNNPTRLTSKNGASFMAKSEGAWVAWSRAPGRGSTDFVNHRGNGSGGYWFYDTDGATIKAIAYLNGGGDLTVAGSLTSTNGFNGKLITVTSDAEFYDWIKKVDTRSQFFRNIGTGSTAAPAFSCGILSKVADSHMAIVGNYSTNVSQIIVTTGNTTTSRTHSLWTDKNTTVDANGFIKKASPIVKLFGDGQNELNDESQGVTTERLSTGVYRVSGVFGFNGDSAWGGHGNGIEIPVDDNKRPLIWIESKVLPDGDIEIRTYHRTYDTGPYSARNIEAMDSGEVDKKKRPIFVEMPDGTPIDIPEGRFIDLRVEMPASDEPGLEFAPEPELQTNPEALPENSGELANSKGECSTGQNEEAKE